MKIICKIKTSYRAVKKTLDRINAKGLDRFLLTLDIIYCRRVLHCSYDEYVIYKFYNFKNRYRKNFLLRYHQKGSLRQINKRRFTSSKFGFYLRIQDCYARQVILVPEMGEQKFLDFVKKHNKIVTKPDHGSLGRGIQLFEYTNDADASAYFHTLSEPTVCEEFICQHDVMNQLNPYSVNTVRIMSLRSDEGVDILSASLRTSQQSAAVDNMCSGGIGAQVDLETGIVTSFGYDYAGNKFIAHPETSCNFMGLQLPNWSEAIALVKKAHSRLPECALLGWDIALTQTGADIIEANNAPGPILTQFVDLIPKGEKVLALIKKNKKENINPNE